MKEIKTIKYESNSKRKQEYINKLLMKRNIGFVANGIMPVSVTCFADVYELQPQMKPTIEKLFADVVSEVISMGTQFSAHSGVAQALISLS